MQIDRRSRAELKQYFVKNAIPTESNFVELIDGMLNQRDDGIAKLPNDALSIEAVGDDKSEKKVIQFYGSSSDANPTWMLSLNPRQDPAVAATAKAGFSISDGAGNSRLFIDRATGNVGIGTVGPLGAALHIDRGATNNLALMLSSSGPGWGSGLQLKNTAAGNAKTFGIYAGSGALHFADVEASTDRMLITKTGDIGIGTATPRGRLDVPTGDAWVGRELHISATSDGTNAGTLNLHNETNRKFWHITHRAGEADKLIFWRNDTTSNPWSPVLKLGMDGLVEVPGGAVINAIGIGTQIHGKTSWPYETIQMAPGHNLRLWYGTAERFVFSNGGFLQANAFRGAPADWSALASDGTVMTDNVNYKAMMIVGSNQGQGKNRWVRLWDYLTVHGGVRVDGEIESGSAYIKIRGLGNEWAYMGGDGAGNDVQIGSTQSGVVNAVAWSTVHGAMNFYCLKLHETSDERLKDNIEPVADALDKVSRLRGVWFDWKNQPTDAARSKNLGLVAQEVKEVVPEAVAEGREGLLAISYQAITVLLIEAMKEQQKQIGEVYSALKELRGQRKKGQ